MYNRYIQQQQQQYQQMAQMEQKAMMQAAAQQAAIEKKEQENRANASKLAHEKAEKRKQDLIAKRKSGQTDTKSEKPTTSATKTK